VIPERLRDDVSRLLHHGCDVREGLRRAVLLTDEEPAWPAHDSDDAGVSQSPPRTS